MHLLYITSGVSVFFLVTDILEKVQLIGIKVCTMVELPQNNFLPFWWQNL